MSAVQAQARAFPAGWDSDDDDEEISAHSLEGMRMVQSAYQRFAEDSVSAAQAAQAALKSVPSKAALDSLEKVDIEELEDKCEFASFHKLSRQRQNYFFLGNL